MAILNFPSVAVESADWGVDYRNRVYESEITGSIQTAELPGSKWNGSLVVPRLANREVKLLKAFLLKMRGRSGRFYFKPPDLDQSGTMAGTGVVSGAGQTGDSLLTSGWGANQSELFLAGDYIEVNTELKMITETISSDASGVATLVFEPKLRRSPADAATITTADPKAIMRFTDSEQARWALTAPLLVGFSLDIVEALDG